MRTPNHSQDPGSTHLWPQSQLRSSTWVSGSHHSVLVAPGSLSLSLSLSPYAAPRGRTTPPLFGSMGPRSFLFGERPPALVAQPPYNSRSSPTSMPDSSQWPDPCWESLASRRIRAPVAPTPEARQIHPASSDVSISPDAVPDTPSSAQVPFSQRRQSQPSSDLHGTDNGPSPLRTSTAPTTAPAASRASSTDSLLLGSLLPKDPDSSSRHRRTRLPSLDSLLPTPRIVSLISSMPPSLPQLWTAPTPPSTLEAPDSNFPDGCPSRQSSLLPTAAAASLLSGSRLKLPISRMLRGWVH